MPSWPRDALKMAVESSTTFTAAIGHGGGNAVGLAVERWPIRRYKTLPKSGSPCASFFVSRKWVRSCVLCAGTCGSSIESSAHEFRS